MERIQGKRVRVEIKKRMLLLVGLPGTGKSYYVENQGYIKASTDDIVEEVSELYGLTYTESWSLLIKFAEKVFWRDIDIFVNSSYTSHFIIDRTNLTRKSRARFIQIAKENNIEIGFKYFPIPDQTEWERRLNNRPGKVISKDILDDMLTRLEIPEMSEGFDFEIV